MLKIGVIGYGFSARVFHLPFIESGENLELTAIASSKSESLKDKYQSVALYSSAKEMITGGDVELAVITTPNHAHFPLAKSCLENRVHVILEKPMTCTSAQAEQLAELADKKSLVLSVFHNRRWDGDFLTIRKMLANRSLGEIKYFESRFDRFRPNVRRRWREQPGPGSGSWFDLGPHLADQVLCLFGRPQAVTAKCLALREDSHTTDYFHVLLHYRDMEAVLHSSPFSATVNNRFRLEGTKGSFVKYGLDPQEDQLKTGIYPGSNEFGFDPENMYGELHTENFVTPVPTEPGRYQTYYQKIFQAVENGGENPVPPKDGITVMKILELAGQSSMQGRTLEL